MGIYYKTFIVNVLLINNGDVKLCTMRPTSKRV